MRYLPVYVFLLLSLGLFADGTQPVGSGTSGSPYEIDSLNNLLWLSTNSGSWSSHFIQTDDIDASGTSSWNSGAGFSPIGDGDTDFTGTYDGDHYKIDGLFIDRTANDQGLFGRVNGATIQNLGITDCSITGDTRVGALASLCAGTSHIINCYSTGSVTGSGSTGGLVGFLRVNSVIDNCWSFCNVTGSDATGGLVGKTNNNAIITSSYARGTVTGTSYVGGLLGANYSSSAQSCYSTGLVNGSTFTGGLVGYSDNYLILNCVWDTDSSGKTSSFGGIGLQTVNMKEIAPYQTIGWDFMVDSGDGTNDIWGMNGLYNEGYPFLAWEGYEHFPPAGTQPSGEGISSNPYTISQLDHLLWLSSRVDYWDKYFRMSSNINAEDTQSWANGAGFRPIGHSSIPFSGTFDGNGYRISNLICDRPDTDNQGMFGYTQNAMVHDLRLINVDITGASRVGGLVGSAVNSWFITCKVTGDITDGNNYIGGLAGFVSDTSAIEDCETNVTVSGSDDVGGMVGKAANSTITGCTAGGSVESFYCGAGMVSTITNHTLIENSRAACIITGENQGAGFVFEMLNSEVNSCYCISDISVDCGNVGGFVGRMRGTSQISNSYNQGTIAICANATGGFAAQMLDTSKTENCYSACTMTGSSLNNGGFVADLFTSPHVVDCFWDAELSGISISEGGTGLTTAEMKQLASYYDNGWDFIDEYSNGSDDYWGLNASENDGYPFLAWQGYEHTAGSPEKPDGAGTEADPYRIAVMKNLLWMANSSGNWGDYYLQVADIELSSRTNWTPIGNDVLPFTGYYDGQGYSIDGLNISGSGSYQGFFGYLDSANVANIELTNVSIVASDTAGGLVGKAVNSTVIGCSVRGSVQGGDSIGGLAGSISDTAITGCSGNVEIIGVEFTGGFVGKAVGQLLPDESFSTIILESSCTGSVIGNSPGGLIGEGRRFTVERCFSSMDVTVVETGGGFIGSTNGAINAVDCYCHGVINAPANHAGGFMYIPSSDNSFTRCYSTCSIPNGGGGFIVGYGMPGTFRQCYWDVDASGVEESVKGTGLCTAEMQSYITFYLGGWDMMDESANGTDDIWGVNPVENGGYPFLSWQGYTNVGGIPTGSGTEQDPYQIADFSHLYWLSEESDVWDAHFVQIADIDATEGESYNDSEGFKPIGSSSDYFVGVYDGQDFAIDGLKINRPDGYYQALFGYIVYGTVRNVRLTNCNIIAKMNSGGIAGRLEAGTIAGCYTSGQITGDTFYIGGMAGITWGSTISGCHNAAGIFGENHSGGIAGWNQETAIIDCCNTGDIDGRSGIGGICGYHYYGEITDCCNLGEVSSNLDLCGGIAGELITAELNTSFSSGNVSSVNQVGGAVGQCIDTTIENCYSTGQVTGNDAVAGFVGAASDGCAIVNCFSTGFVDGITNAAGFIASRSATNIQNCFYDTATSGMSTSNGGTGLPTDQMKDSNTFIFNGWDFKGETMNGTEDFWKLDGVNNSGYPLLSWEEGTPVVPVLPNNLSFMTMGSDVVYTWDVLPYVDGYRIYSSDSPNGIFTEDTSGVFDNTSWIAPMSGNRRFYMFKSYIDDEGRGNRSNARKTVVAETPGRKN